MSLPRSRAEHIQKVLRYAHGHEAPMDLVEKAVDEALMTCNDDDWTPKFACNLIWRKLYTDSRPLPFPGYLVGGGAFSAPMSYTINKFCGGR